VPLPAVPVRTCCACPGAWPPRVRAAARAIDEARRGRRGRLRGYVSAPRYLAARQAGCRSSVARGERPAGRGQPARRRLTRYVRGGLPGTPLRGARVLGLPLRRSIIELDRPPCAAPGGSHFGLQP
jgi:UDP-N-acetylglucosamine--N-acetylmuramyl-(pentapeptide) pyrophosphoryl-undecaprenol N-acetylglucosamine transferase